MDGIKRGYSQVEHLSSRRLRLIVGDVDLTSALDKPRDTIRDEAWQKQMSGARGEKEVLNPRSVGGGELVGVVQKPKPKLRQKMQEREEITCFLRRVPSTKHDTWPPLVLNRAPRPNDRALFDLHGCFSVWQDGVFAAGGCMCLGQWGMMDFLHISVPLDFSDEPRPAKFVLQQQRQRRWFGRGEVAWWPCVF